MAALRKTRGTIANFLRRLLQTSSQRPAAPVQPSVRPAVRNRDAIRISPPGAIECPWSTGPIRSLIVIDMLSACLQSGQ